jgi:hypothetical protein
MLKIMASPVVEPVEIQLTQYDLKNLIFQYVIKTAGKMGFDDAGCDWYTDDDGSIYINNDGDWLFEYNNTNLAALVDAANIIAYGKPLKLGIDN